MPLVIPPVVETSVLPFPCDEVWERLRKVQVEELLPSTYGEVKGAKVASHVLSTRKVCLASGGQAELTVMGVSDSELDMMVRWKATFGDMEVKETVELKRVTICETDSTVVTWTITPNKPAAAADWSSQIRSRFHQLSRSLRSLPVVEYEVPELSDDEVALFYGSYPVKYSAVAGTVYPYTEGCLKHGENTAEARAYAKKRLQPVSAMTGDETCNHVYQPTFPCVDLKADFDMSAVAGLPEELRKPLLKTRDGTIRGIRSGGRSGLLMKGRTAYRLKGCGNYVDGSYDGKSLRFPHPGMPVSKMTKLDVMTFESDPDAVEIRGVAFPHACQRELLMSKEVEDALKPLNIPCALIPVGYMEYCMDDEPYPSLKKACGVFRTLGERRVASHLLAGLEILLPQLVRDFDQKSLVDKFPEKRRGPIEYHLYDSDFNKTTKVYPVYPTHASEEWIDASTFPFVDTAPSEYPLPPVGVPDAAKAEIPAGEPDTSNPYGNYDFRALWGQKVARYAQLLKELQPCGESKAEEGVDRTQPSVLAHLYWRIGREAGAIRRAMNDSNISWGYYCDHSPEALHNNSHPNNFVILPEGQRKGAALIAPLDFDMSYTRETHFFPPSEEIDLDGFDTALKSEVKELRENLGGSEASTGLAGVDGSAELSDKHVAARFALRDTLIVAFDTAFGKKVDIHPTSPLMAEATHTLATLALIAAARQVS